MSRRLLRRPVFSWFKFKMRPGLLGFLFFAFFLYLAVRSFMYLEANLRPSIVAIAETRARQMATEAISNAINQRIARDSRYEHLIFVQKDNTGNITMAEVNNAEIARIQALTTMSVQDALENLQKQKIEIPLGQALGSKILANLGPRIPVTLVPVGSVRAEIQQTFASGGINIVSHQVGIDLTATVKIVVPFMAREIQVRTFTPLVTAAYFGKVPETVINLPMPYDFDFSPLPEPGP